MFISGTMACKSQDEFDSIFGKLSGLPVDIATFGLDIAVEYEPKDTQTEQESEHIVARLIDIIESVDTHGISRMLERK